MSDPLSVTASIIAVLQLSSDVVKYINAAAGSAKERKRLRDEVRACEYILRQLKDDVDDSEEGGRGWRRSRPSRLPTRRSAGFPLPYKPSKPNFCLRQDFERLWKA